MITILGLDIGGANVKTVGLRYESEEVRSYRAASLPFEIWREKERLPEILQSAMEMVFPENRPDALAVTMTAELADVFATKREGVGFVLDRLLETFPGMQGYALSLQGEFVPLVEARLRPLEFAASNWLATALYVGQAHPDCLLVDVGTTTTDVIPILNGQICALGRTDLERLAAGELVYTGVLRTNLAAIVQSVPVRGRLCRVSSEDFAISGDVYLILGFLRAKDYTCPTPDGRPATRETARVRLARLVCADTEMLVEDEIDTLASYVAEQQLGQVCVAIQQVLSRIQAARDLPLLAAGSGAFLALKAGKRLGLDVSNLGADWGKTGSTAAPSLAVAFLLAQQLSQQNGTIHDESDRAR
ncbi:MAG TPA: hydantoinase/oxoprolinase family protein [Anaerolineaceae bacterium]|nr:hydantoinase/oxoprolinase family protein [Anaerolineaceae bacterium]